jgi:hypothetical protein
MFGLEHIDSHVVAHDVAQPILITHGTQPLHAGIQPIDVGPHSVPDIGNLHLHHAEALDLNFPSSNFHSGFDLNQSNDLNNIGFSSNLTNLDRLSHTFQVPSVDDLFSGSLTRSDPIVATPNPTFGEMLGHACAGR